METRRLTSYPYLQAGVLYVVWLGIFFYWLATSWVSEDAYITLRVVDNFSHGYGLRWNIHERVQVYTHPLWLLLHLPFSLIWDNLFHLNMALSLVCASLALAIFIFTFHRSPWVLIGAGLLPVMLSKCVREYAGSGLETSLSYLLFAMLGYVLLRQPHHRWFLFFISLITALLLLTRLDHLIILAPLLACICYQHRHHLLARSSLLHIAAGAWPLFAWHLFALVYYGFFFPNTKYAKLNTGIPLAEYLAQGWHYMRTWIMYDTMSAFLILSVTLAAFFLKHIPIYYRALAMGVAYQLIYVFYIGGDYMLGRFYAVPTFIAIWLLVAILSHKPYRMHIFWVAISLIVVACVPYFLDRIRTSCPECLPHKGRITNSYHSFRYNTLFSRLWPPEIRPEGNHKFVREARKEAAKGFPAIKVVRFAGAAGFYAGAEIMLVDELGLCDVLLARLPVRQTRGFYAGHFHRALPSGYLYALKTGSLERMDNDLQHYYKNIQLITEGELLDRDRLMTIIRFNLGEYDHYKEAYLAKQP